MMTSPNNRGHTRFTPINETRRGLLYDVHRCNAFAYMIRVFPKYTSRGAFSTGKA